MATFDIFVVAGKPFSVGAPKSGSTGEFDIFITQQQPFGEYAETATAVTNIVGDAAGTSTVVGLLKAQGNLHAVSAGTSTATGNLSGNGSLVGTVAGISVASAIISGNGHLIGTVAGTSTATGTLSAASTLTASSTGTSTVLGFLRATGRLAGTVNGSASVTGKLTGRFNLQGAASGSSSASAIASLIGRIHGLAIGSSSSIGILRAKAKAIGNSAGTSTAVAILQAIGRLAGLSSGTSTASATVTVITTVAIVGSASGTSTASGKLIGVAHISGAAYGMSSAILFTRETTPMLSAGIWRKNQPNTILFVLSDNTGVEVTGLGSTFTLQISKTGGPFATGGGTKSEIGLGWYKYVSTAGEADASGPVALVVTHASIVQQNLEYTVEDRVATAVEFTYTLTSTAGGLPIPGADISFSINSNPANVIWSGITDAFGVARDFNGNLPRLSPGSYYIFAYKPSYVFQNPDVETVS